MVTRKSTRDFDLSIKMQTRPLHAAPNTVPGLQPTLGASEGKEPSGVGEFSTPGLIPTCSRRAGLNPQHL